jgi:hypothetical protein
VAADDPVDRRAALAVADEDEARRFGRSRLGGGHGFTIERPVRNGG